MNLSTADGVRPGAGQQRAVPHATDALEGGPRHAGGGVSATILLISRTSERANERASERASERANELANERTNERANKQISLSPSLSVLPIAHSLAHHTQAIEQKAEHMVHAHEEVATRLHNENKDNMLHFQR